MAEDLGQLLALGERAAFHGPPAKAVVALEQAVAAAQKASRAPEAAAASWLLGLSLGAAGRYGSALQTLTPLLEAGEATNAGREARLFAALAGASLGSVRRQLGRHSEAREADQRGAALTEGGESAFACRLGLAADAVGLGEADAARAEMEAAIALLPERPTEWWRQRVRLDWVRAEVALLDDDPKTAISAAEAAVERAEKARAPRHVAKSLLFQGVAHVTASAPEGGASALRRAATLAEGLGALPLVWSARAVLGAVLIGTNATESATSLGVARSAVLTIASDLPDELRADWLGRPDIAALLEG
ncbi:MAG TPA: hypothetical protein VNB94_11625 [Mycobacteriales bacterium]|nr:hypothetical protein [Mycobacteriales bacterium]